MAEYQWQIARSKFINFGNMFALNPGLYPDLNPGLYKSGNDKTDREIFRKSKITTRPNPSFFKPESVA